MKLKAYTVNDLNNIGEIITISYDCVDGNNNNLKTFKSNDTIYIINDIVNKISDNTVSTVPVVDSITPDNGAINQVVSVTIKGKNLYNLKSIQIGSLTTLIFTIIDNETITVNFPATTSPGLKTIIFNFNSEFSIVLKDKFTYYFPAPTIDKINWCPQAGQTICTGVLVNSIVLSWIPPKDNNGTIIPGITQYKIFRNGMYIGYSGTNTFYYIDNTYVPGILYDYTVKAFIEDSSSFFSNTKSAVYPLSKPLNILASNRVYTNQIKITWDSVFGAVGYNIYRNGSTTPLNTVLIKTTLYNDFDSTIIPETAYTYTVKAVSGIYNSVLSNSATGYKLLGPPTSIEASDGLYPDKVKIEWGALPNVSIYKVYREGTLIHTETSTNSYYDITGALNTEYLYGVSSVLGSKESTIITDVGFSYIIVKPVINSVTLDSATGNITISWQLFSGADSYYLYRDGVLLTNFINSPTTQTYTDTTSKTGKCYSYTLKAESNSVMSVLSDAKSVCVPLNAPVNLTASITDTTQITLTWSAPTPLNLPVGVGVTYYVYRNNNLLEIILQNDVLTYNDLSAAIGVNYTYKIKAQIIIDSVATISDFSNSSVGIRPGVAIPPPINIVATDGTNINNISVTWEATGAATSYTIWRELSVGGGWSTPENIGNQDYSASVVLTTKTDSLGSSPLTEYYKQYRYSVVANDSISGTSSDYSLTDTGYLKPIIGSFSISASTIYDFKIQISWSAVTGTEGYEIYRSTTANGFYTKIGTSPTTNYDDTDSSLIANTSYYYKVKTIFFTTTSDLSTQYATGIKIPLAPRIPVINSITNVYYYDALQYGECCAVDRTGVLYRIKFLGTNLDQITKIYFGTVESVFDRFGTEGGYIYRIPRQQGTDKTVNIYIKYGTPEQTITWPTPFTYFGAPVIDTPSPALIINDWDLTHTITGTDLQPIADGGRIFTIRKLELFSESDPSNIYDLMGQIGSPTNNAITITDVPFMDDWSVNPGTGLIGLRIETFLDLGSYGSFTFSTTKNNYLEYQNAIPKQPTITNVIPSFGQNTKIPLSDFIITGTNFDYVDTVYFVDSTPSKNEYFVSFTKNSDTQITVLAANFPNYTSCNNQFWEIKVRTSYQGTLLYTTYPNAYRFIGTPTITNPTSVIPKYVSTVTPTPITITGTKFIELNSAVSDNNVTLKVSIQAVSPYAAVPITTDITITADSPITTASNTSITTTVPAISGQPHGQKRSLLIEEDYSKASVSTPTVAGINSIIYCQPPTGTSAPNSGTTSTPVTITGTNFLANSVNISTVKFGTTTASFTGTPSNTTLTVLAPALSGVQTITLETPGGSVTVGSFTYNTTPSITSVSPNTGYVNTSTAITINGTNLLNVDSVTINGISVTGTITPNPGGTQITGISAPSISTPGTYTLVASKSGGITASTNFQYTYPPPTITGVNPNTGILAGGTSITITGSNFITGATVSVGGAPATNVVVASATSITAKTPNGAAGLKDVVVTTAGGTATLSNAFTYTDTILATISLVSPQYGPVAGSTSITITGTSLTGTTSVTVGGNAATSISVNGAGTLLTALTPTGTAGLKDIIVTTPINAVTSTGAFTYYGLPTISGVSPSTQTIGSLSNITITGSNLDSTSSVTIGGASATIVGTPTSTTVVVIPPSTLTSGSKTISLTTRGGTNNSFSVTYNLSVPTGVTATDGTDNTKVAISWSSVSGASGYDVYIGTSKINTSTITGTSYDDTSATPGTTYAYTVKATDATGSSSFSSSNNGWRNTQPISVMTATDGTYTNKVIITWTNPATTTGITSYSLFRGTTEITSVTSPYNDTGATPGISYTYEVKSVSASGTSLLNTTDTGYTRISSPTGLTASDGSYTNKIALAWTVPTTGTVTGFDLYRDGVKITALGSGIAAYDDTTAVEGISYTYTIKSNSATGDSLASTSDTGWRNIGPPIGTITASQGLLDRITIAWTAVTSATGYNIYRNGSKVNSSVIIGTTYDDIHNSSTNNLTVEIDYSYTIESVTAAGVSATKSTAVTGKRVAIPTTTLTASQGTSTSNVVLNWTDVSAETEYVLYKTGVELFRPVANAITYTDTTGSVGTSFTYEIAVNTAAGLGSRTSATGWKKIAAPALTLTRQENQLTVSWSAITGATDYEVVDASGGISTTVLTTFGIGGLLNPNNQYTITVKARYLISTVYYYSDTSSVSGYTLIAPPSTAPSASTTDTAKIVVSWNAVTGASGYEVYRSDNSYSSALATGINTTTYNDTAATAGTSYKYKIKSVCANSTSGFSSESSNGVKPLLVLPPTGVTASYGTFTDKVTINWVHATLRDTYKLYYKDSGGVYTLIASGLTANTYDHVPLQLLDYYEYYLTTVKSGTESNYSLSDSGCFDIYQQSIPCNIGYRNCVPITDLAASYETSPLNISLKWTPYAASTGLTQYEIIRSRQQGNDGEDGFQTGSCAFTGFITNSILTVTSINPSNPNWKILPNHTIFEQNQGTTWPVSRNTVILSQLTGGTPGGVGTYQLYSCDSTGWQTTANTGSLNFISTLTTFLTQTVSTPSPLWTTNFLDTVVDAGYDTYYKIRPYRGTATRKVYGPQSFISKRYIGNPASYENTGLGGGRRLMSLPKFISTIYPTGNNNNPLTGSINMPYYIGEYTLGAIKIEIYRDTSIVSTTNITSPTSAMAGNGTPVSQPYNDTTAVSYIPYEYYIKQTINNTGQDQISEKRIGIRGAVPVVTTTTTFYTKIDVSWNTLSVAGNSVSYDVYRDGMFLGNTLTLSYTDTLGAYCSFSGSISSDLTDKTKATLNVTSFSAGVLTLGQYIQYVPSGSSTIDRGWKVTGVSGYQYTIQNMLGTQRDFSLQSWTSGDSLYSGAQYQIKANITNTNTYKSIVLTSGTNTTGVIQTGLPTSNVVLTGFTTSSYLPGGPMDVGGVISLTNIVAAEGCGQTGTIVYIDNLGRMDYTYSSTVATNTAEARDYLKSLWLTGVKCVKLSSNSGASSVYQYFGVVLSNGKLLMWGTTTQSYTVTTMKNVCGGQNGAVLNTHYTLVGATSKLYLSNGTNYADIACGGYHAIALFTDGKVYSSAGNTITYTSNALPSAESATTFTKVAAGNFHSIGLRTNGTVVCWGHGATITGAGFLFGQAIVPSGLGTCIDIAAGGYLGTGGHSVAVRSGPVGDVWAWGNNQAGQCGGAPTTVSPYSKSGPLYYSDGTTAVTGVSKVSAGSGSTAVAYTTPLAGYSTGFIGSANAGVLGESGYGAVSYISCRHYTNILLTPISSLVDIQYWKYYTEITNYNYDTPEIGNKSYRITKTFAHFGDLFTNNSEPIQDYYEGVYKVSVYRYEEKQFSNQTTNIIPLNETIYERTEILYNTYSFENEACPFKDESGTYSSETQCVIGDDLGRVNIDPNIYSRITFSNNTSSVEFNETNYAAFANTINICNCFENKYLTEGLI